MVCGRGEIINPTIIKLWGNTCCTSTISSLYNYLAFLVFSNWANTVFVAPRVVHQVLIWPLMNTRWKWYINPDSQNFSNFLSDSFWHFYHRLSPWVPGLSNVNQTSSIWEHVWIKQTNMKHQSNPHPSTLVQVRISAHRRDDDDWCRR